MKSLYHLFQAHYQEDSHTDLNEIEATFTDLEVAKRECDRMHLEKVKGLSNKFHYAYYSKFWVEESKLESEGKFGRPEEVYRPERVIIGKPEPRLVIDWSTNPPTQRVL